MSSPHQNLAERNPLAQIDPWNRVATSYVEIAMPFLAQFTEYTLTKIALQRHMSILDVATGPGTLACHVAPFVAQVNAVDFSEEMVLRCKHRIAELALTNVSVQQADGQRLPFAADTYDATFSMFGLMFFPERIRGFSEMLRVLKPGGQTFVTSWAPIADSPLMLARVAAQRVANPDSPPPQTNLMTLEDPEVFRSEMSAAGFVDIAIEGVVRNFVFRDLEHLVAGMTRGNAPFELIKQRLGEAEWARQLSRMREYLSSTYRTFPMALSSKAWLGSARKP